MKKEKQGFQDGGKVVTTNRRARAKYEILETLEAGIILTGPEVKSVRAGNVNLQDGFVRIDHGEAFLWNVHVNPYPYGSTHVDQQPLRSRKLLLNRNEINRWIGKALSKGLTVVPLDIHFNKRGMAKVTIALAKGKKTYDRREELKRRTIQRELQKSVAGRHRIK